MISALRGRTGRVRAQRFSEAGPAFIQRIGLAYFQ